MENNERYRITLEKQLPDGTWQLDGAPCETGGYLVLANQGKGMKSWVMNLSDKDLALMIAHQKILRETVIEFIPEIIAADHYFRELENGNEEGCIDAEKLLTQLDGAPQAKKPGWLGRIFGRK